MALGALFITLLALGGPAAATRPCDYEENKGLPFCDVSLSIPARVKDVVSRISDADAITLLVNTASNVSTPRLDAYQWWNEGLHGVARSPGVSFDGPTPVATSFPQVVNTGATFNRTLPRLVGSVISTEARAFNNLGNAGLTYWAPNINILRDPRWGRGQETPGEDPYHTASYAREFVRGMQEGDGEDPRYLKVSACCKHFAAYDLEDWGGVDRFHFDAKVSARDLADTYFPAFQACVEDGRASGVMCSYNAVNGVPSCADSWLLQDVLRSQWAFDGYVTSDCEAVYMVEFAHNYTSTTGATCAATLRAGMDTDCGHFLTDHGPRALSEGAIVRADLDKALTHLFRVQMRLGMFDPATSQPYLSLGAADINTAAHQRMALDAARQSMVLLKNSDALPLSKSSLGRVAFVGPHANATKDMLGNYYGIPPYIISPLAAASEALGADKVAYAEGCDVACNSTDGFKAAAAAAQGADATVVFLGLDLGQEAESNDRTSLSLPGYQEKLLNYVEEASSGPVIVVVMAGGPVDLTYERDSDKVAGLMWAGYAGQSGGQAVVDALLGAYNPGGRLPYTLYPAKYTSQVSMLNMDMRPGPHSPGRTYRFYNGTVAYPFGAGISYTQFSYKWNPTAEGSVQEVSAAEVSRRLSRARGGAQLGPEPAMGAAATLSPLSSPVVGARNVTVTNTGKQHGDDVVLFFIVPPSPGVDGQPLKSLAGFERVSLAPGESATVTFYINLADIAPAAEGGERVPAVGTFGAVVGVGANAIENESLIEVKP